MRIFAGINCSFDDPCVDNTGKPDCPAGMKCFGPCNPNVFCTGIPSTGIPQCYGCMEGWTGEICNQDVDECKGKICFKAIYKKPTNLCI